MQTTKRLTKSSPSQASASAPIGQRSFARAKRHPIGVGALVAVVALIIGWDLPAIVGGPNSAGILVSAATTGLMTIGIGFLSRHLGLLSLGHAAIFGVAAYGVAISNNHWHAGPQTATLSGFLFGIVFAVIMGLFVMRSRGMAFLMLTLALGQAAYQAVVLSNMRSITGAFDGAIISFSPDSTFLGIGSMQLINSADFWPIAWVALVIATFGLWLLGRSRFGTVLHGIRENEERMRFSGYDTVVPRFLAFVATGAAAALGGALFALNASLVSPEQMGFGTVNESFIAVIVGGSGSLLGPIIGSLLYSYSQSTLGSTGSLEMYTGIALIVVIAFFRGGVAGAIGTLSRRIAKSFYSRRAVKSDDDIRS